MRWNFRSSLMDPRYQSYHPRTHAYCPGSTCLFAIGVELPKSYVYHHAKGLLSMVVLTMAIGWIVVDNSHHSSLTFLLYIRRKIRQETCTPQHSAHSLGRVCCKRWSCVPSRSTSLEPNLTEGYNQCRGTYMAGVGNRGNQYI